MKNIIYPGTFDPITNGHLDIAERASSLFDEVMIVIANNPRKNSLFTIDERIDLIDQSTEHLKNVNVSTTESLIVNFDSDDKLQPSLNAFPKIHGSVISFISLKENITDA